jgi:DNA-binding beta-propeller fold protein YncE
MRSHRCTLGFGIWLLTTVLGIMVSPARADFFVGSNVYLNFPGTDNQVLRYDNSGNLIGVFATVPTALAPRGLAFGPDGNLYIGNGSGTDGRVQRYDGSTGAFIDDFVPANSGGLKGSEALIFQNDGFLYVSNFGTNPSSSGMNMHDGQVTRYNATTGAFDSVFVASTDTRGNCDGMAFGPNGDLFVSVLNRDSPDVNGVLSFDGTTGAFKSQFTQGTSLTLPRGITFGPDGNLYVVDIVGSSGDSRVARFDGTSGQYIDDYIPLGKGLLGSRGLGFGPDGRLYVSSASTVDFDYVWVFDGTTLSLFIDGNADGSMLTFPTYFVFK